MTQTIRVLLIEDNRIEARQTQHWLSTAPGNVFVVDWVEELKLGIDRLSRGDIDIVLLDLNLPGSRGLETFMKLHQQVPAVPIVVLTGEYDPATGPLAVEKGAEDYLVKQQADSLSLVRVLLHSLARHRAHLEQIEKLQHGEKGRVIAFIGTKGGVGTTTVALNTALAMSTGPDTIILAELQASGGTLAYQLHQEPDESLASLFAPPLESVGPSQLTTVLRKGPGGLRILFGPQQPQEFVEIHAEQTQAVVTGLAGMAKCLILDLPSQPSAAMETAVGLCDFVAVVTEREPCSVWCGKSTVKRLRNWGVDGRLIGAVVVNRTVFPESMPFAEIRSQLGCEIVGVVPSAPTACLQAARNGIPMVLSQPDEAATMNIIGLAKSLAGDNVQALKF